MAERICERAHDATRLRDKISVLRIGQLCGDTENGIWNASEAWPIMLSSVNVTVCLPDLNETLDWLPVDIAAQAVVQFALSGTRSVDAESELKSIPVLHILNPNTQTTWADLLSWLKKLRPGLNTLPPNEWVRRVEDLQGDAAKHPARKLLGLWKGAYVGDEGGRDRGGKDKDEKRFEMEETKRLVGVMGDVGPVTEELFGRIWRWVVREMM